MKALVTGGTGFIGSNLVKRLLDDGRDVIVASDFSRFGMENLSELGVQESDIEIRDTDLTHKTQALKAISGTDTVFHMAARVGSLEYLHLAENAELVALQANLSIDASVFQACLENGVKKLVYASSCAVYDMGRQFKTGAVFSENELLFPTGFTPEKPPGKINPDGGYGWSKLMGELQLNWTKSMDIGIARLFNIYGTNEPIAPGKAHATGDTIRKVLNLPSPSTHTVFGNGSQTRDLLYVADCVEALLRLEKAASNPPVTVNVGSGIATSIRELAEKIVKISGKDIRLVFDTSKPAGPVSRTADMTHTRKTLGWQPAISLDEGLNLTYEWVKGKLNTKS
ncbi:MAG: NAD-dependent epimerase/dehydratase family protein [Dehalococcoidales bacterium]|nr:NAD-dependent epimerase/dehydratase family protein [Dehalococcoidales bacterium]